MGTVPQSSLVARVLSVSFFLILTVAAFFWFVVSITDLVSQIHQGDSVIEFDKGAVAMLGIGLGLLLLTVGGVIQGLFGKDLTPKYESLFTKGIVVSILLVFLLPHTVHYAAGQYIQKQHYALCNEATYRWFLYSKFYYTDTTSNCDALVGQQHSPKG